MYSHAGARIRACDSLATGRADVSFAAWSASAGPLVAFAKDVSADVLGGGPLDISEGLALPLASVDPSAISSSLLAALTLPQLVARVELGSVQSALATLGTIDLTEFQHATCHGGGGWPFDGGWYGLHFWVKT